MSVHITPERVREVLVYDPATGVLAWRIDMRAGRNDAFVKARAATRAGFLSSFGYRAISIDGKRTSEHRVAWVLMTGMWPEFDVDHINGQRSDNRWANLRAATRSQNMQNLKRAHVDSETGLLGVERKRGRFAARICVDGRKKWLGVFDTAELAHAAYLAAKRQVHERNTL
jgi:hypothetical protein